MSALTGKTALITGGAGGIGRATAEVLARDGAQVTIASRSAGHLEEVADRLGPNVRWTVCDATVPEQVLAAIAFASEPTGRLDMAVSVPGAGLMKPLLMTGDDEFMADVDFNVRAPYLMIKHAGRQMARDGGGAIVAISSTAAVQPARYLASYCAAKAAVDMMCRVAADELGAVGVRVNVVRPGLTATDAPAGMIANPQIVGLYMEQQPITRVGEPDDIAQACRYLVGPESSWVTGQCLTIDGGHTLRAFPHLIGLIESRWGADAVARGMRGELD